MATTIVLTSGDEITTMTEAAELVDHEMRRMLRVEDLNGRARWLNPDHIVQIYASDEPAEPAVTLRQAPTPSEE